MPDFSPDILAQALTTVREETRLELARWSTGNALLVGVLVSALALYAVAWMYRREGRGDVGRRLRWTLVGCRVTVLVLLGVIGLEPVLAKYVHRRLDAFTLVLLDESASMSLNDRYRLDPDARRVETALGSLPADGVTRAAVAEHLVNSAAGRLLDNLANKNHVKVFGFGDRLQPRILLASRADPLADADTPQPPADEAPLDPANRPGPTAGSLSLDPIAPATNIGLAVRGAVDAVAGSPVAAIVLLTDGGFNEGEDPTVVSRFLKQKNVPLYAVGIGDPAQPINVRITDITAPRSAFKNDPFSVTVRLDAQGIEGRSLTVELLERDADTSEPARVVETRTVSPDPDGGLAPVVFERKIPEPGTVTYIGRVGPVPFEAVLSDNQREILPAVQVLDDQMRVLLIAGGPSYDYRYLTRLLQRDASVDLSTWLQSADVAAVRDGNTIITELPAQPEDLYEYDAIIFLDASPVEFDPTWASLIATFVADHGGGILYGAGHNYTGRFLRSPKSTAIVELLPIVPEADAEIIINDLGHYQTRAWPILIPDQAAADPILRLADDPRENQALWGALEGVYWHYPVRREKPVANALMRHSNPRMVNSFGPHVLFATQFVGAGRSAYLGIDSTWRWRHGDESHFNRFWIQTLRYLVEGKLLGGRQRGLITTPRDQYGLGASVVVTARALDVGFEPLVLPELELGVSLQPGGRAPIRASTGDANAGGPATTAIKSVVLTPIPGRPGYYQGRMVPDRVGTYRLSLELPGGGLDDAAGAVQKDIVVTEPDIEMRRPAMQRAGLMQLAEAADGRYFDIDQINLIPELIQDRSRTFVIRERPRPLWDNKYVLIVLVAILTLEWILRKKAKLL